MHLDGHGLCHAGLLQGLQDAATQAALVPRPHRPRHILAPHLQQVTVCVTVFVDRKARGGFAWRTSQLTVNV